MQKIDLEQAKEKETAEAKHKLSQQEQEIETIRKEVSLVCPWGLSHNTHLMQKTDLEQAKEKELAETLQKLSLKEQEVKTIRVELSEGF